MAHAQLISALPPTGLIEIETFQTCYEVAVEVGPMHLATRP